MVDLSKLLSITFEIGNDCNLKNTHKLCPINKRVYPKEYQFLTTDSVVNIVKQAYELNFEGYIAFHYYNEPLLYRDRIIEIMDKLSGSKFGLWSNGLLIDRNLDRDPLLERFDLMVFTCYKKSDKPFFEELKELYKNVTVLDADFDDRLDFYNNEENNIIGCKRPWIELPIDYYGNIHTCCYDWNGTYTIGNVFEKNFKEIILGEQYQRVAKMTEKRFLDVENCPEVCRNCRNITISYSKELFISNLQNK